MNLPLNEPPWRGFWKLEALSSRDGLIVRSWELDCEEVVALEELILDSDGGVRVVTTWVTFFEKNFSSLWYSMSVNRDITKNRMNLLLQMHVEVLSIFVEHLRAHSQSRIQSQEMPFDSGSAIV